MDDRFIDVGGLALRVRIGGQGPPLLFTAPGWGPSVDPYITGLGRLQDHFTVAWVDPRRTGRSGQPADGDYDTDALVSDFDAVRRALGWDTMWIGGHSKGGQLALRYLAKFAVHCRGLLGLCTYGDMDDQFRTEMQTRLQARSAEPWFATAMAAFSGQVTTDADLERLLGDALPAYLFDQSNLERARRALSVATWSAQAFGYYRLNEDTAFLRRVRGSTVPALIVAADEDFICSPPLGRRIHEALPNSTLVEISRCGHFPWLEQPEQFWSAVDLFLDTHLNRPTGPARWDGLESLTL